MSDYKDIIKRGWHPEKKGESLKNQVVGSYSQTKAGPATTTFYAC